MCVYIFTSPLNMTVLETVGSIAKYYEEKKPHSGIFGFVTAAARCSPRTVK